MLIEQNAPRLQASRISEGTRTAERSLTRFADFVERRWRLCLVLCTVVYLIYATQDARIKPFWFDELFTYYTSLLPDLKTIIHAGQTDTHPFLQNYFVKLALLVPGPKEIVVRLPNIIGFWVMSVCLFQFVRRRSSAVHGFVALLIPLLTDTRYYAVEARPYALSCGFAGLALLFWQLSTDHRKRLLYLVLLAISLGGGVCSHYYGVVQVAFPIGVAEFVRTLRNKRIDVGMWIACALGVTPLLVIAPLGVRAAKPFSKYVLHLANFWHHPELSDIVRFYGTLLHTFAFPAVAITCYLLYSRHAKSDESDYPVGDGFTFSEKTAAATFLIVPIVLIIFTMLRTGYFMDRYAETAICGVVLLVAGVLFRYFRRNAAAFAVVVMALLIAPHVARAVAYGFRGPKVEMPAMPNPPGSPLVMADAFRFTQLSYYAPPEIRSRLVFVVDLPTAVKLPDLLPELSMIAGRWYLPWRMVDYAEWTRTHPNFALEYNNIIIREWLPKRLTQDGYQVTMDRDHCCTLFYASRPANR